MRGRRDVDHDRRRARHAGLPGGDGVSHRMRARPSGVHQAGRQAGAARGTRVPPHWDARVAWTQKGTPARAVLKLSARGHDTMRVCRPPPESRVGDADP